MSILTTDEINAILNHAGVKQDRPDVGNESPTYHFALRQDLQEDNLRQFLPNQGEPQATGYDVRAAQHDREPIVVSSGEYVKIPLGFRGFCPEGWWYKLEPRSSTFAKKNLHALCGIIDETYENELVFAAQYLPADPTAKLTINFGDAIGQIIPVKRQLMTVQYVTNDEMNVLYKERGGQRGTGGFGSTGG